MHFVAEQSSKYNMTPVLTFNLPLYWKSMSLKEEQDESSALLLVNKLLVFLKAERTGDWQLHLDMSCMMLPYFAASGHYHYQKSVYLYLQAMSQINMTHPGLYKHFMNGLHVIRTSDRLWAGLSPDLMIEQVLMRSLKTSGGLTRGHGMSKRQQAI